MDKNISIIDIPKDILVYKIIPMIQDKSHHQIEILNEYITRLLNKIHHMRHTSMSIQNDCEYCSDPCSSEYFVCPGHDCTTDAPKKLCEECYMSCSSCLKTSGFPVNFCIECLISCRFRGCNRSNCKKCSSSYLCEGCNIEYDCCNDHIISRKDNDLLCSKCSSSYKVILSD